MALQASVCVCYTNGTDQLFTLWLFILFHCSCEPPTFFFFNLKTEQTENLFRLNIHKELRKLLHKEEK